MEYSKNILSVIDGDLISKKNELNELSERYYLKINELDKRIIEIETHYIQRFNQVSEKHEAKHGHMITPKYEQDINNLEKWKANKLKPLEERITILNRQMEEDSDLKNLKKKIDSLEELSRNQLERLREYEKEVNDTRIQLQSH